ncbi:hypothetical protein U6B65_13320 [Oscillospiraceae bacterium MB08-C2-2]|nr:hypothetical protein U6B65_13320 [Oscillospiraceae bacterium MB08-C2-2]
MLARPTCLRIPDLYEESMACISWESVDGAEGYELDIHYDEDFEAASIGKTWGDMDEAGLTWMQIDVQGLTWAQIEKLPAQGLTWQNIEYHNLSWAEIEQKNLSWSEIQRLPVRFTVYKGTGEKTPAPDQGLTWQNIDSMGLTWAQIEARAWSWQNFELQPSVGLNWAQIDNENLTWTQIEARGWTWQELENQVPYGLTWGSLDGHYLTWNEFEELGLTWQQLEKHPADAKTHITHTVKIPTHKKKATFRVRSYEDSVASPYLETSLLPIVPIFYREDSLTLAVKAGSSYAVQLHAKDIDDFKSIVMALEYPTTMLRLDELGLETPTGKCDFVSKTYKPAIQLVSQKAGQVKFRYTQPLTKGYEWDGLVISAQFTALQAGNALLTLS